MRMDARSLRALASDRKQDPGLRSEALLQLGLAGMKNYLLLARLALDQSEPPAIRDRAADSIGDLFEGTSESKRFEDGVKTLTTCLEDPSPEVRFTACFSLGKMRARSSFEHLERLASYDTANSVYGRVCDQARRSIEFIRGERADLDLAVDG